MKEKQDIKRTRDKRKERIRKEKRKTLKERRR